MKKLYLSAILLLLGLESRAFPWTVRNFECRIAIAQNGVVTVQEQITADFTLDARHGIYRFIPLRYPARLGHFVKLRTKVLEVRSSKGDDRHWISFDKGRLYVKIGNPDLTRRETVTYTLLYKIQNAINNFPEHDEFYWNVTGNEWAVPLERVRVEVSLPSDAPESSISHAAYAGVFGSHNQGGVVVNKEGSRKVIYETTRALSPHEGLTVVLGLGKGILRPAGIMRKVLWFMEDNWPYSAALIVLFFLIFRWKTRGKDPAGRGSIVVTYEPPSGMTPAEVGTLIDEKVDLRDITATLVDLAVRGYMKIEEDEDRDFIFHKLTPKNPAGSLKKHEEMLLNRLFSTGSMERLSLLKNKFYVHIKSLQNAIYEELSQQHFANHPQKMRTLYRTFAAVCLFGGVALFIAGMNVPQFLGIALPPVPFLLSGVACAVFLWIFAPLMPQKTLLGKHAYEEARGLEEYISRAEAETMQDVDLRARFERLLPYAMCFELTKSWTRAFEKLYAASPEWYSTRASYRHWTLMNLSNSLNRMDRSARQVFVSVPRTASTGASFGSSGFRGGYSGGGFGGGGGGAW